MVWVVGRWGESQWELQGIYTNRDLAQSNALKGWFVAPVPIDKPLPEEAIDWPELQVVE